MKFALALALLLTACASDSVLIGQQDLSLRVFPVTDIAAYCAVRTFNAAPNASACAEWGQGWCNIYVSPTTTRELLGHELQHCLNGKWHE